MTQTNNPSEERTTLLEFPCEFPLKIMGKHVAEFPATIVAVVKQHAPDFDEATMRSLSDLGRKRATEPGTWSSVSP